MQESLRKRKQRVSPLIIIIIIIIICALAGVTGIGASRILASNSKLISERLFESNAQSLTDTYTEVCYRFEENAEARWNYLEDIGLILANSNDNGIETVTQYLDKISEERGFTGFYLVNENGEYHTLQGVSGYIDFGKKLFSLTDEGQNIIVDGSLPKVQNAMFYAIPVEENRISGFDYCILALGYTVDDMVEQFRVNAYDGQSNAYITYTNGRVCTSADNNEIAFNNIIAWLQKKGMDEVTVAAVEEDLKAQQINTIQISVDGKSYYLHYQPVGLQDWMMVSLTAGSAINAAATDIQSITSKSLWTVFAILTGIIVLILGGLLIAAWRRGKSEVAKRDRMFKALSEYSSDAYIMLNFSDFAVDYVSPTVESIFDRKAADVKKNYRIIASRIKGGFPFTEEELHSIRPGEELTKDVQVGENLYYHFRADRHEVGNLDSLILVLIDRTKDEEARQQIQAANEELTSVNEEMTAVNEELTAVNEDLNIARNEADAAREQAEAANKAKTSFLFNMSHDIRTPMNAIIGYSDLLNKYRHDPQKVEDYLGKIKSSSDFLLSLINNVLEMARIESGRVVLDEFPCESHKPFDEIVSVYTELMKGKNIEFSYSENIHTEYLYIDSVKLNEIFLNIVSNAYKYTPEGGKVSMTAEEIGSDLEGHTMIQTTISDTGIGMSKDFLPVIFEEFSRERTSTENKIQGTGLGMPIVKKLAELMNGTIEVQSELGKGSTFIITIPHRIAEKPTASAEIADEVDYGIFAGKRILLAEDNDLNAEIAAEILGEFDFKVERAEDGIICVDMLTKAEAGYYDLILMDIQMPNLDGYGAAKRIRALDDQKKADIPIIAMTANAFDEDKRNAINAGMDGHIAKPIEIPVLMRTLADVFKDRSVVKAGIKTPKQKEDPVAHVKKIYFEMQRSKAVSVLPGGFFAYMAEQPEKLIFANDLCCSIWGCKNFEEFNKLVGESFKGIVHPDDYERAEKEIWHQIDSGDTGLDQVKYKIIKKDGTVSHVDDYGRLVRDKDVGDIFYVFVAETLEADVDKVAKDIK